MYKNVIGLMSGTSLDGLDISYIKFHKKNINFFEIIQAETIEYDSDLVDKLRNSYNYSAMELMKLDADFGKYLGNQVQNFIKKHKIKKVDLIASHGQTVFHRPDLGYTTQIGSGAWINSITKIKTICDFRTQDVALGGQGAPLVPIGDKLLFPEYKYCLNIGGFANISIKDDNNITAFDICPANIVLNHYINKMGLAYDKGGKIASKGEIHSKLLYELNNLSIYKSTSPKSFGWEFVEAEILPIIDNYSLKIPDILRTYVEHTAMQIANKTTDDKMLITGGGAYHNLLIERIDKHTSTQVVIPTKQIIDFKEALIFALLGHLKDERKINILSQVTGAEYDHSSGVIFDVF